MDQLYSVFVTNGNRCSICFFWLMCFPLFLWPFVCVCVCLHVYYISKMKYLWKYDLRGFCLSEVRWWLHGGILSVLYICNVSEQSRKAPVNRHLLDNLCWASPALSQLSDDVELRNTDNPKHFKMIYNTH